MFQMMGKRTQKVYDRLLGQISDGHFAPGARLPTEKELCEKFSVGRNTLRQAVGRLVKERRLVTRQGSGTYVLPAEDARQNANVIALMCDGALSCLMDLQATTLKRGHLLQLYLQDPHLWSPEPERLFLEQLHEARPKALVAFCSPIEPRHDSLLQDLVRVGVRVIHVAPHRVELPDEEYVMPDYRRAGYMGAVALMLAGYDELYFVSLSSDGPFALLQEEGFAEAMRDYGREYDPGEQHIHLDRTWDGDLSVVEPMRKALASGRSVGIHCRGADQVSGVGPILDGWDVDVPGRVGLIGSLVAAEGPLPEGIDVLRIPEEKVISRALEIVLDGRPDPAHELVPPEWVKQGAVRASGQGRGRPARRKR